MSQSFGEAHLLNLADNDNEQSIGCSKRHETPVLVLITKDGSVVFNDQNGMEISRVPIEAVLGLQLTNNSIAIRPKTSELDHTSSLVVRFFNRNDLTSFRREFQKCQTDIIGDKKNKCSVFDERTEVASASQYFQFYSYLSQQQNMMQDYVRTATYQRAMLANAVDFRDKVVMDVGAGSGILSFFAIQAQARTVYAVEASSMAEHCQALVKSNNLADRIKVIAAKVEDIHLNEKVDVIISEPMGYMLFNERMLESFLYAKKFLKPGGRMYPSRGDLHLALFNDELLYLEQSNKASFWCQESFYGVNLTNLLPRATGECFRQPIVDTWHVGTLLSVSHKWTVDFETAVETDLHLITIPFQLLALKPGIVHGVAFWFDVAFVGGSETIWLSTGPTEPLTHWYQVRCLVQKPLLVAQGQLVTGKVIMTANDRQSYDVDIELCANGLTARNTLDLKNPYFRYTGQTVMPPPGNHHESPTDQYFQEATASNSTAYHSADVLPYPNANGYQFNGTTVQNCDTNIMDMLANAHAAYRQTATSMSNVPQNFPPNQRASPSSINQSHVTTG